MPLKIAIIGAGPAGCMLARIILHNIPSTSESLDITIFEAESTPNFRSQGGTLDLHTSTGQLALRRAGLWNEFEKLARYDGEAMKIADKKLLCYLQSSGGKPGDKLGRPEIDRPQLREMLYHSLPEGLVQWGMKLLSVDENRTLHFANGQTQSGFDLIVGADGAWSKVRNLLTDERPYYSGVSGHSMCIPRAAQRDPELEELVNKGSVFSFSDGKSVMAQYMSDGSLNIGTWSMRPADWRSTCGFDVNDPKAVKAMCRQEYADWDERLLRLTQIADDSSIAPRDLYMLPIGHKWEHKQGVTLVGDSAHLMTPFAGEGVNLAFKDCVKLADAILSSVTASEKATSLDAAVKAFEEDMFVRAKGFQQMTYDMMEAMYFTADAPRANISTYVLRAIESEFPGWRWLLAPVVHTYFFFFKLIW